MDRWPPTGSTVTLREFPKTSKPLGHTSTNRRRSATLAVASGRVVADVGELAAAQELGWLMLAEAS